MSDVVNPKGASPVQLLPYYKKISVNAKALMICFYIYTFMVLKSNLYKDALLKHDAIINELKQKGELSQERVDYLEKINVLLQNIINDLRDDLEVT